MAPLPGPFRNGRTDRLGTVEVRIHASRRADFRLVTSFAGLRAWQIATSDAFAPARGVLEPRAPFLEDRFPPDEDRSQSFPDLEKSSPYRDKLSPDLEKSSHVLGELAAVLGVLGHGPSRLAAVLEPLSHVLVRSESGTFRAQEDLHSLTA